MNKIGFIPIGSVMFVGIVLFIAISGLLLSELFYVPAQEKVLQEKLIEGQALVDQTEVLAGLYIIDITEDLKMDIKRVVMLRKTLRGKLIDIKTKKYDKGPTRNIRYIAKDITVLKNELSSSELKIVMTKLGLQPIIVQEIITEELTQEEIQGDTLKDVQSGRF